MIYHEKVITLVLIIGITRVVFSQNAQVDWVNEFGEPKWWHWPLALAIVYFGTKYAKKKYHDN